VSRSRRATLLRRRLALPRLTFPPFTLTFPRFTLTSLALSILRLIALPGLARLRISLQCSLWFLGLWFLGLWFLGLSFLLPARLRSTRGISSGLRDVLSRLPGHATAAHAAGLLCRFPW